MTTALSIRRIILIIISCRIIDLHAQSPDEKIDPDNFNIEYLEHLVKTKIDSVRQSHSLYPLVNDSILYLAAKHHAGYLVKNNILSHFEKNNKYANPQLRAEQYGAQNYFTGENVASIFILTPTKSKRVKKVHINETYEDAALELAIAWVKSKPHYKNIKHKKYQITGLALVYDKSKKNIKAVQKFAEVKSKFVFEENTRFFPYAEPYSIEYKLEKMEQVSRIPHKGRHRWRIKKPKKYRRCSECRSIYSEKDNLFFYVDQNKNIHAVASNPNLVRKIVRRQRDGLAVETVQYTPYECGNTDYFLKPSRRNGQCVANGTVQKPHYKWKMKREWRKAWVIFRLLKIGEGLVPIFTFNYRKFPEVLPTIFEKYPGIPLDWKIGKLPQNDSTYYEINILLLKGKRQCGIIHFTDFCGAPFEETRSLSTIPDFSERPFIYPEDTLKNTFIIPFEKNKYEFSESDIVPLVNKLKPADNKIVLIDIAAFSSVEGKLERNEFLMNKRAQSIIDVIRISQNDSIAQSVHVRENWEQFYEQIKSTPFAGWKSLKQEKIKTLLESDSISEKLESLLSKQRKAVVTIHSIRRVSAEEKINAAKTYYKAILQKAESMKNPAPAIVEKLLSIQYFLYNQVLAGKVDTTVLFETDIPRKAAFGRLLTNQLFYKKTFQYPDQKPIDEKELYESIKEIALFKGSSNIARYNLMTILVNNWKKDRLYDDDTLLTPKKMYKILKTINLKGTLKDSLKYLHLNFYFKAAEWSLLYQPLQEDLRKKCLNGIYGHYITQNVPDTTVLKIAKYFIWHYETKKAYRLLKSYALRKNPNHDIYMLFLKMSYVHGDEEPRSKFLKWMADAAIILTQDEYCGMFTGPCNMSFQVFDNETVRNTYCSICKDKSNFALEYKIRRKNEKLKK